MRDGGSSKARRFDPATEAGAQLDYNLHNNFRLDQEIHYGADSEETRRGTTYLEDFYL
jgi:hypothetical protein